MQKIFEQRKEGNSSLIAYSDCAAAVGIVDAEFLHGFRKQLGTFLRGEDSIQYWENIQEKVSALCIFRFEFHLHITD